MGQLPPAGEAKHALVQDDPVSRKIPQGCRAPAETAVWLFDVCMSGVVDLLHVDLGNKHQVAVVVVKSFQVEVILLGFCLGIQVVHLAPRAAGWGQKDFIRYLRPRSVHDGCLVIFNVEVPTSLITEDLNIHAHRFCNCRLPRTTAVDFPKESLS